jgi:hypothetical protein
MSYTHKYYATLRKILFSTKGIAEIHIQRPIFDSKKCIPKIVVLKIQMASISFVASSL